MLFVLRSPKLTSNELHPTLDNQCAERNENKQTRASRYPQSSPSSLVRKSSSSSIGVLIPSSSVSSESESSSSFPAEPFCTTSGSCSTSGVARFANSSAVNASLSLDAPDRSAATFFRFARGERRTSESTLPFSPTSDGVKLRSRFRLFRGDDVVLLFPRFSLSVRDHGDSCGKRT